MLARLRLARLGPIPASVLAGFLAAGLLDALVTVLRAPPPTAAPTVFLLALALYGAAGLVAASVIGLLAAGVLGAIPGGSAALVTDPRLDRSATAGILSAAAGVGVAAIIAGAGQAVLVRPM